MMSIRSLADFNGSSPGGAVTGWRRHRHRPGLTLPADTTTGGWGLLTGHQRGPAPGHTRGLCHGHGHQLCGNSLEVSDWLSRFPAAFPPPAFASWTILSRWGSPLSLRSAYQDQIG